MDAVVVLFWILVLAGCAWGSGAIARGKGYDFAPFCILGFFLGIIGIIIAAVLPNKSEEQGSVGASNAEALASYKKLLDEGAITQEEFDKKKSELLGV